MVAPARRLRLLIARSDPDLPKHRGVTYFLIDMQQPGVDVRALRTTRPWCVVQTLPDQRNAPDRWGGAWDGRVHGAHPLSSSDVQAFRVCCSKNAQASAVASMSKVV